jgi:cardiolipin synthase
MLACAVLITACASPRPRSERPPTPAAATPSSQALAAQLRVRGAQGRLTPAQRQRLLDRLAAEGQGGLLKRHLAVMAEADEPLLFANNGVQLLIDGPSAFTAMFAAIESARHSVLLQSYIVEDTAIAQQLATLLARKRAQGVQVALLYDDLGSIGTSQAYFEALRAAGVASCALRPVSPLTRPGYWNITQRDHRKILVVDRATGFTGGINISAVYASGSFGRAGRARNPDTTGWRDTQVRIQGPAVAALDDQVRTTWLAEGCAGSLAPPPALPAQAARAAGTAVVRIIPVTPDDAVNRIYSLLLTAIDAAQRSVYLTMAYFAPGQDMLDALCDAARRGVDVQLVLPARSDFAPVLHAGRSYYSQLLAAGVQVHELQDAVLHAKTAVIDGVVSTVGSSNMDWRSFAGNSELNAVVFGDDFGAAMQRMFQQDVQDSQPITLQAWNARPLLQRTRETLARWFEAWW